MKEWARISVAHLAYVKIARKYNDNIRNLEVKLANSKYNNILADDFGLLQEKWAVEDDIFENSLIVVTFSAMCLEAFIYDYAAISLTDNYVKKYIDKLDVVSKWVIVPKLVSGKSIDRSGLAFQLLKKTIKARNDFVHSKSEKATEASVNKIVAEHTTEFFIMLANDCIKAIDELAKELESIDPESKACFSLRAKDNKKRK